MKLSKKVTDFIVLDEGNIGRRSAVVTGAALASSVLGTVLAQTALAGDHCDAVHIDQLQHGDCYDGDCHFQWVRNHTDNLCD